MELRCKDTHTKLLHEIKLHSRPRGSMPINPTELQVSISRQLAPCVRWQSPHEVELAGIESVFVLSCTLKKLLHDAKAILQAERQHADCRTD